MHGQSLDALLFHQQLRGQRVGLGAASHDELIRRLTPKCSLDESPSTSIASVCSWSQDGTSLANASDGCVKVWDTAGAVPRAVCSVDTGHPTINGLRFFPETSNSKLVTVSSDKQARVVDLERMAIRPFSCHKAKIRAVAVVSPNVFLTGCEDGVVRQLDVREQPLVIDSSALRDAYCAESIVVEQRSEKTKDRVGVNSIAVDPLKPMFATGGGDPLVRVYDARMMSRGRPMPWVLAYGPNPVVAACSSRSGQPRQRCITSVAYDHTGHRLLASYSKDSIYSFSVKDDCFFPSTLPRELGGPSPRVPSSSHGPGDIARPGNRATLGNTEACGATRGRVAAAAPRLPPRQRRHAEGAEGLDLGLDFNLGVAMDQPGGIQPSGQPIVRPATALASAAAGPNTGTTAPSTFQTPRIRDGTATGVGDPGFIPGSAGNQVQGAHDASGMRRQTAQGGAGLLQRAFTPFGQALYRRWVQHWGNRRQQQQQQQQLHQQSPQEGGVPGARSSFGQPASARALPSRLSGEGVMMEESSVGLPLSSGINPQQQQQQQQQGNRGVRRARPSSSPPSPTDQPSDAQPPHSKRPRLSPSGAPRPPSSTPPAPAARAKSRMGRTSARSSTQPPSPSTLQPASAVGGPSHAQAHQLHPVPQRLTQTLQQQRHQQQHKAPEQGAVPPSWHNPRASGQRVPAAVRVRMSEGAEEPLILQSTPTAWPNVHPHGPNSSRTGLHRVGASSQWRADTPLEGQSLPAVPHNVPPRIPSPPAQPAPQPCLQTTQHTEQGLHTQEPGEGCGRDHALSRRGGRLFRGNPLGQQQQQQEAGGVGGLNCARGGEGVTSARGGGVGATAVEGGHNTGGHDGGGGVGGCGDGARNQGDAATGEGEGFGGSSIVAAAAAAAQPLDTLSALGLLAEGGTVARTEPQGLLDPDVLDALGRLEALGALEAPQRGQQGADARQASRGVGGVGAAAAAAAGSRGGGAGAGGTGAGLSTRPPRARAPVGHAIAPGQSRFTTAAAIVANAANAAVAANTATRQTPSRAAASSAERDPAPGAPPHTDDRVIDMALVQTDAQSQQCTSSGALARAPSLSSSQLGQLHGRDGAVIAPANTSYSAGWGIAEGSAEGEMDDTPLPTTAPAAAAGAAQGPLRGHSAHAAGRADSVSSPPQCSGAGARASADVSVQGCPSEHTSEHASERPSGHHPTTSAPANAPIPDPDWQAHVRVRWQYPPPEGVAEEDNLPLVLSPQRAVRAQEPEEQGPLRNRRRAAAQHASAARAQHQPQSHADQGGDAAIHEACSSPFPVTGSRSRLTAQPATRFAPQQPRHLQQPPLLLNRIMDPRRTPNASGNQGTDTHPNNNNNNEGNINSNDGNSAPSFRAARRQRHAAAQGTRARAASAEPTPYSDDPDARNMDLLLSGIQSHPLGPSAADPAGRPQGQPPRCRRARKPVKSRDRRMPYQSVDPHQDLVMRHACLTYLAGSGGLQQQHPSNPPSHAQHSHNNSDESHGAGGRLARLCEDADDDVLQGADSLGRLHACGRSKRQGQEAAARGSSRREDGGEGRQHESGSRGQRQRRRRLGVLVVDSSDSQSGDDGAGDGFTSGRPMYQQRFSGHRNVGHPKEAAWMGRHSEHVVSGSDDGCVYLWNATNGRLLCMPPNPVPGHVASCIQPHPFDPILATCGTEPVVRLWSPEAEVATKLSTSQLASATLNMMEGDNLPEEEPADPMPGVAGWAELVSRHFGRMAGAGAFETASPGRGVGRAAAGRVRQRRRDTEEETEGRASASAAPRRQNASVVTESDGDQPNASAEATNRPPEGSSPPRGSPGRGSPFPCRFM